ncbi:hypothetical protein ACNPAA_17905, partial [Aeromonas sp. PS2Canimalfood6]
MFGITPCSIEREVLFLVYPSSVAQIVHSVILEVVLLSVSSSLADFVGLFYGSSRDPGKVEVDRQGAGKLVVAKHTTTITLLSPCIILILPPSGQVIPSSPKRFLPTITPCLP